MSDTDAVLQEHYSGLVLLDLVHVVLRHKVIVAAFSCGLSLISLFVVLSLDDRYTAVSRVVWCGRESGPGWVRGPGGDGGQLAVVKQLVGGARPSANEFCIELLDSRRVCDGAIAACGLRERWRCESLDDARRQLRGSVSFRVGRGGLISINVTDTSPESAAEVANALVHELDSVVRELVGTEARRRREFLSIRLDQAHSELREAEDKLREYQEQEHIFELSNSTRAAIEVLANVKARMIAKEAEVGAILSYATENNATVQMLRAEIHGLGTQVEMLEKSELAPTFGNGVFIPMEEVPRVGIEYARLYRGLKIRESVCELLIHQFEMARIDEARDSPTIQVVDAAVVPKIKSGPPRRRYLVGSVLFSIMAGVLAAFFAENIHAVAGTPHGRKKLEEVKKHLGINGKPKQP